MSNIPHGTLLEYVTQSVPKQEPPHVSDEQRVLTQAILEKKQDPKTKDMYDVIQHGLSVLRQNTEQNK